MLDLYRDGNLRPSSDEIAERAGLSPRSLFRYFDDMDDLARAAIQRQRVRAQVHLATEPAPTATRQERVAALVAARMELFDFVEAAATVSRLRAPFEPVIAEELGRARSYLRAQVARVMGPELAQMPPARAASTLAVADVLCSFEAHQLLVRDQSIEPDLARAALIDTLVRLFDPEAP